MEVWGACVLETHYFFQKKNSRIRFEVNKDDSKKISQMYFTIFEFISASFSFSHIKKQLTIKILELLKERELTFSELVLKTNAKKSTLYLLLIALENAGLICSKGKGKPYSLSLDFSNTLEAYASWWRNWVEESKT